MPQEIFVHCLAHHLNLALQQIATASVLHIFDTVSGLPLFFYNFAKRTYAADTVVGRRIPTRIVSLSKMQVLFQKQFQYHEKTNL